MNILFAPYRALNAAYRAAHRQGWLRAKRLHRPVISIGNIAMGGTGKTPAVIAVSKLLREQGLRVAVLSRGYRRGDRRYTGIVADYDAKKYGDEPVLIKRAAGVDVFVGSNRYANARKYDYDVFVLDDGFQHLRLGRDLDLVIDAPARFYREGRSALRDADVVIPRDLRLKIPDSLRGRRLFAFAGLADNEQFFASLREAGLDLAGTQGFRDHHRYTPADLARLKRDAKGATLVTTEKDAVKIDDPEVVAVGAELVLTEEARQAVLAVARAGNHAPDAATAERQPQRRAKRRKHPLLQRIEYVAYRLVVRFVAGRSDETLARWGSRLGTLSSKVLRGRDRLAMRNLKAAFPERSARELRKTLDECWQHFGREMLVYVQMQKLSLEEVASRCDFVNTHHIQEAIDRGKGTLLITAHWGGWEVAGLALMAVVQNVRTVARPLDNELLERDLQQLRAKTGAEMVDRRRAARVLLRGLAENAVVVLLPDQAVQPREGILVPFLGRPAWTTPAPAKMALRADSTIVFGFCIPDGPRHRIEFDESIRASDFAQGENDAEMLTTKINEVISRRIRERPELWLWMHDRWKGTGEVTNAV